MKNSANYVTINSGAGNDTINNIGDNAVIYGGAGNDTILNDSYESYGGFYTTIDAGDGQDSIRLWGSYVSLDAGNGNDYIEVGSRYIGGGKNNCKGLCRQ